MIIDFKTPLECPHCHQKLKIVQIEVAKVLNWIIDESDLENEGKYKDNGQGATDVFCYHCGEQIGHYDANDEWGLFPDSNVVDF
jgi:hypothetical protein